jgi:hypothetical protein
MIASFTSLDWKQVLITALAVYASVTGIFLISENRRPQATLAWLFAFLFIPGIGLALPAANAVTVSADLPLEPTKPSVRALKDALKTIQLAHTVRTVLRSWNARKYRYTLRIIDCECNQLQGRFGELKCRNRRGQRETWLDSALLSGRRGRRFKSSHPDFFLVLFHPLFAGISIRLSTNSDSWRGTFPPWFRTDILLLVGQNLPSRLFDRAAASQLLMARMRTSVGAASGTRIGPASRWMLAGNLHLSFANPIGRYARTELAGR